MPLTITKTYLNGNILTETDLDNAFNSVSTLLNTTLLDSSYIQTGGLIGANLANGTIAIAQMGAQSVGTAQLTSSAVTTAIIAPAAVTTVNIASSAVSRAQQAPVGQQVSGSCGNFTTTNTFATDVTNLTLTITGSSRPILLALESVSTDALNPGWIEVSDGTNNPVRPIVTLTLLRGASVIWATRLGGVFTGTTNANFYVAPPGFLMLDTPGAGTFTYKIQAQLVDNNLSCQMFNLSLVAYEL